MRKSCDFLLLAGPRFFAAFFSRQNSNSNMYNRLFTLSYFAILATNNENKRTRESTLYFSAVAFFRSASSVPMRWFNKIYIFISRSFSFAVMFFHGKYARFSTFAYFDWNRKKRTKGILRTLCLSDRPRICNIIYVCMKSTNGTT